MIVEHYSQAPLGALYDVDNVESPGFGRKPSGLWVSVPGSGDWPTWCTGNEFELERLQNVTRFTLADDHNVLIINMLHEFDAFHARYHTPCKATRAEVIDWKAVSADHDGIIIAHYFWSRRLQDPFSNWYYGWDCASGCIWRPNKALQRLEA